MKNPLLKFRIGLAVIGLFTIGIVVLVLVQAGVTKQDNETTRIAQEAAQKLNAYIIQNQVIPDSLSEAGANESSANIHYTKTSAESYRFCVNYKTAASGFSAMTAVQDAASGNYTGRSSADYTSKYYLVIPPSHTKGEFCQTIEPFYGSDVLCGSSGGMDYQSCTDTSGSAGTQYFSQ